MKGGLSIFFTGASSFTGYWFVRSLARSGNRVTCLFTKPNLQGYAGLRRKRVQLLLAEPRVVPVWGSLLRDSEVMRLLINSDRWDVFCHHAAEARNHKSPDFNPLTAAASDIEGLESALNAFKLRSGKSLVFSGTYFESGKGLDGDGAPAFSPYAVSKSLAAEIAKFYAHRLGIAVTKFVMANPFGPYEERGFTTYLAREWLASRVPSVQTPEYKRDNVPVTLMASHYVACVQSSLNAPRYREIATSGYAGKQGTFAREFALRLCPFFGKCPLRIERQLKFEEPLERMNLIEGSRPNWDPADENKFWQALADFYRNQVASSDAP